MCQSHHGMLIKE